jgi:8-oxo-dGTP pyrophosphatase MutT (NUDIX family)
MKTLELTLLYPLTDNNILLAMKKRGFGEGKWNGVGGKIESEETVEEALVRECQEEIGVTPIDFRKVGYLVFNEHHDGERKLMNLHIFTATELRGEVTETEEMRPKWFSLDAIPYKSMWPADRIWLPRVLNGELIQGEFTLGSDDSVESHNIKPVKEFK